MYLLNMYRLISDIFKLNDIMMNIPGNQTIAEDFILQSIDDGYIKNMGDGHVGHPRSFMYLSPRDPKILSVRLYPKTSLIFNTELVKNFDLTKPAPSVDITFQLKIIDFIVDLKKRKWCAFPQSFWKFPIDFPYQFLDTFPGSPLTKFAPPDFAEFREKKNNTIIKLIGKKIKKIGEGNMKNLTSASDIYEYLTSEIS